MTAGYRNPRDHRAPIPLRHTPKASPRCRGCLRAPACKHRHKTDQRLELHGKWRPGPRSVVTSLAIPPRDGASTRPRTARRERCRVPSQWQSAISAEGRFRQPGLPDDGCRGLRQEIIIPVVRCQSHEAPLVVDEAFVDVVAAILPDLPETGFFQLPLDLTELQAVQWVQIVNSARSLPFALPLRRSRRRAHHRNFNRRESGT